MLKIKQIVCLAMVIITLLWVMSFFTVEAKRDIRTDNISTLKIIAFAFTQIKDKSGGRLPNEINELWEVIGSKKLQFKSLDKQRYDWLFLFKSSRISDGMFPLVVSPYPDDATQPRSRLVLWSDYHISIEDVALFDRFK